MTYKDNGSCRWLLYIQRGTVTVKAPSYPPSDPTRVLVLELTPSRAAEVSCVHRACARVATVLIGGNFVNRESILDVKTKSCDAKYPAAASEVGAVVNKLAVDIDHKYHKRARDLDSKLGTPDGAKGPFERELDSYGLNGKVVVPVVGAFAEMSTDVHSIADFIALVQAEKYCSFYNESLADAKGMLMQRLYRLSLVPTQNTPFFYCTVKKI